MFLYLSRFAAIVIILSILGLAITGSYAGLAGLFIYLGFNLASSIIGIPVAMVCTALTTVIAFVTMWGTTKSIWNNLTYLGQKIDTYFMKYLFNRDYFIDIADHELDEVKENIKRYRNELSSISGQFEEIYYHHIRPLKHLSGQQISDMQQTHSPLFKEIITKCENFSHDINQLCNTINYLSKKKLPQIEMLLKSADTHTNLYEEKKEHLLNCINKFTRRLLQLFTDILVISEHIDKAVKTLRALSNTSYHPSIYFSLPSNNNTQPYQRPATPQGEDEQTLLLNNTPANH